MNPPVEKHQVKPPRNTGQKERLAVNKFSDRHGDLLAKSDVVAKIRLIAELFPGPGLSMQGPALDEYLNVTSSLPDARMIIQLKQWWRVQLLQKANAEHNSAAYRQHLRSLLVDLGVSPPSGVLVPDAKATGKPDSGNDAEVYAIWKNNGQPKPAILVKLVYGKVSALDKPRLAKRVDAALRRHKLKIATK